MTYSANPVGSKKVIALTGGVGGAKLALGLSQLLTPEQFSIVVNTGDDFKHCGLTICPDIDTLIYTLAGANNKQQGWGLADEGWAMMTQLKKLGGPDWFQLGDKDLATHLLRLQGLQQGQTLSQITAELACRYGVKHAVIPMSDQPVHTMVQTDEGELSFQHYFVKRRCEPIVKRIDFVGQTQAVAAAKFSELLADKHLLAVIICPSNPYLSIAPILAIPGVKEAIKNSAAKVLAVSPIISGKAVKGPTAKIMQELQMELSAITIAQYYADLLDGFILDERDRDLADQITPICSVKVINTLMTTLQHKQTLAQHILAFIDEL